MDTLSKTAEAEERGKCRTVLQSAGAINLICKQLYTFLGS